MQYGQDPNFTDQTTTKTTESTTLIVDLQAPGPYFWRVRAELTDGIYTDWPDYRTYTVLGLSGPGDDPQAPNNDENQNIQDVVLDWAPIAGAKSYDLRIGTDSRFLTVVHQQRQHPRDPLLAPADP